MPIYSHLKVELPQTFTLFKSQPDLKKYATELKLVLAKHWKVSAPSIKIAAVGSKVQVSFTLKTTENFEHRQAHISHDEAEHTIKFSMVSSNSAIAILSTLAKHLTDLNGDEVCILQPSDDQPITWKLNLTTVKG